MAFWPLARAQLAAGRLPDAIEVLRHGLGRQPDHVQARLALARALLAQAAWAEAEVELAKALAVDGARVEAYVLLGEALLGAGDAERATNALEQALALDATDELAAALLESARERRQRKLGKLALSKKKGSRVVEEKTRRRRDDDDSSESTPPPRRTYAPEDPFAPLPEEEWRSEPPASSDTSTPPPRPLGTRRVPARATGPRTGMQARARRRRGLWLGVAGVLLAAAAGAVFVLRAPLGLTTRPAPRFVMPADVPARLALDRPGDYRWADGELDRAGRRPGAGAALAALAEERALALLEYGERDAAAVETVLAAAASADGAGGHAAELAIARAALSIARLPLAPDAAALAAARADADRALAIAGRSGLARWLDGVLLVAAGDRGGARAAFTEAARGDGAIQATLGLGDLALDAGDGDAALAAYDRVLARVPGHPLALIGRALAHAERAETAAATPDLDAVGPAAVGRRLTAWLHLARARAGGGAAELGRVDAGGDRRLMAWLARARAVDGDFVEARRLRGLLGGGDPVLTGPVDAELLLAGGLPDDARAALATRDDLRARVVRGLAFLDVGRPAEAEGELRAARALAPDEPLVLALHCQARVEARVDGDAALAALATLTATGAPGPALALGEAELALGDEDRARAAFATARAGALAYRGDVRLAELELAAWDKRHDAKRLAAADEAVRAALAQAPESLPARALLGRVLVAGGQPAAALAALGPVADAGRTRAVDDLALAEALLAGGDRERAKEAVRRALQKGAAPRDVAGLAARIDKRFAAELPR